MENDRAARFSFSLLSAARFSRSLGTFPPGKKEEKARTKGERGEKKKEEEETRVAKREREKEGG